MCYLVLFQSEIRGNVIIVYTWYAAFSGAVYRPYIIFICDQILQNTRTFYMTLFI